MTTWQLQHQADTEKGFQVREQVRQAAEEGLQKSFESELHLIF